MNYDGKNVDLTGKMVEGNPTWINRAGMVVRYKNFSSTMEFSYVGKSYSDANNTAFNPTGATGLVSSYHLLDWAFDLDFLKSYNISGGINNLANTRYFTRRINMYPGPGILPGDGRSFYLSVGIRF
jgi:Fe(3+) dicitrate transport protein